MGKYFVKKRMNGDYYFNLLATNGQIIATSVDYSTISAVENGIASVRKNAETHIVEYSEECQ